MKKGDVSRTQLLNAAEALFCSKGYEQTSVQDILDAAKFSKGGFYHHFDSKLSVLEAICQMRAQKSSRHAEMIAGLEGVTAVEKLNEIFSGTALFKDDNKSFASLLLMVAYREDAALMREKMKQYQLESLLPSVECVLAEGVKSGEFFVGDLQATAMLLLRLYMQFTDEIAFLMAREDNEQRLGEEMLKKLLVYRQAIERTLIAPFASIEIFDIKELQQIGAGILRSRNVRRVDAILANETK